VPTFDVTIQGKKYHVEIPDPGASPLQVVVDGEAFDVHLSGGGLSAQPQRADAPRPAPEPPTLPPLPKVALARPASPIEAPAGGHEVTAPMPGTILSVAVKVGDAVVSGQVVCVLEAMKMKNPIRASFDGTVTDVAATPGQTAAYGEVLVRLA
jgi:glutaconyl-CoA/methylmalonyl-CoA decarboxylase subunit gamma